MSSATGPSIPSEGRRAAALRAGAVSMAALLALALLSACAGPSASRPKAGEAYPQGYSQRGVASWYGPGFHGKTTANGERYDMHKFTAAHRTLPMGSLVEVRSLTTGRRVKVRINDRGPFVRGRIIDLSYKAARALGMTVNGTDEVQIHLLGYVGGLNGTGVLSVQVGSFAEEDNAAALRAHLAGRYPHVRVVPVELFQGRRYRVLVGQYVSEEQAETMAGRLSGELAVDTLVIRDDS